MSALEEVRRSVASEFDRQNGTVNERESTGGLSLPGVSVSGSQPSWLGTSWRVVMTLAALVGAGVGLWLMADAGKDDESGGLTTGLSGSFAIIALILAFLTVGGFGKVEFTLSPADTGGGNHDKTTPSGAQRTFTRKDERSSNIQQGFHCDVSDWIVSGITAWHMS